jgi:hypothetical protein
LPQSKVFHGIGVASLHDTLLDSNEDVHLLFKSSPFGCQSHGHNPQNTFQLNAYSEALLTTCVYRDLHGSKFHIGWCHSTIAHNSVLVNGEGQIKHSAQPGCGIVDERLTPRFDYVCGNAAAAYGGKLTRFLRHAVFVKPDLLVLCDDLAAPEPASFQFMLHALKEFTVDEKAARLSVERPKAGVVVQYLSPGPLAFRQWDGYQPKPTKEFPNQWHVEAGTQDKSRELGMLTVIVLYRTGKRAEWSARRVESETALGTVVTRGGKEVLVAIRKHGVTGPARLGELTFEGGAAVREENAK